MPTIAIVGRGVASELALTGDDFGAGRAKEIGLVNEIAIMCDELGVDTWEVIDAGAFADPGGGDWPALSNDGENSYQVNVRAVWETHDGARILVQYYGFIVLPPALQQPGVVLNELDPASYYFRTAPTFRTGDPRYLWLNKVLCVGIGRFTGAGLGYRIFQLV